MSFRYRFCRVMSVVSNAWICHPEVGFIFLFQKQRYPNFCKLRSITVLHFCLQCAESAKKRRHTAISLLLSVSFLSTCHHPPNPHNPLRSRHMMADIAYNFTRPAVFALLVGYRSISGYHIKGLFHPKTCHLSCFSILNPFTAAQRQPYSCATARLPLGNSNPTVAQR